MLRFSSAILLLNVSMFYFVVAYPHDLISLVIRVYRLFSCSVCVSFPPFPVIPPPSQAQIFRLSLLLNSANLHSFFTENKIHTRVTYVYLIILYSVTYIVVNLGISKRSRNVVFLTKWQQKFSKMDFFLFHEK